MYSRLFLLFGSLFLIQNSLAQSFKEMEFRDHYEPYLVLPFNETHRFVLLDTLYTGFEQKTSFWIKNTTDEMVTTNNNRLKSSHPYTGTLRICKNSHRLPAGDSSICAYAVAFPLGKGGSFQDTIYWRNKQDYVIVKGYVKEPTMVDLCQAQKDTLRVYIGTFETQYHNRCNYKIDSTYSITIEIINPYDRSVQLHHMKGFEQIIPFGDGPMYGKEFAPQERHVVQIQFHVDPCNYRIAGTYHLYLIDAKESYLGGMRVGGRKEHHDPCPEDVKKREAQRQRWSR